MSKNGKPVPKSSITTESVGQATDKYLDQMKYLVNIIKVTSKKTLTHLPEDAYAQSPKSLFM